MAHPESGARRWRHRLLARLPPRGGSRERPHCGRRGARGRLGARCRVGASTPAPQGQKSKLRRCMRDLASCCNGSSRPHRVSAKPLREITFAIPSGAGSRNGFAGTSPRTCIRGTWNSPGMRRSLHSRGTRRSRGRMRGRWRRRCSRCRRTNSARRSVSRR
jgi:hypothetical protein